MLYDDVISVFHKEQLWDTSLMNLFTLFLNGLNSFKAIMMKSLFFCYHGPCAIMLWFVLISCLLMPLRILILMIIDPSFGETKRITIILDLWFYTFLTFIKRSCLSFALMKMFCYLCELRTFSWTILWNNLTKHISR